MITTNINRDTFEYYINTSSTIIYAYNLKLNKLERVYKSDWATYCQAQSKNVPIRRANMHHFVTLI